MNPAGWDRQGNTYWLFDDNRMWIQRVPPKAPSKSRSRPPAKKQKTAKNASKLPPRPRPAGRRSSRLSGAHNLASVSEAEVQAEEVFASEPEHSQPTDEASEWFEFETICITKSEWTTFCERFAASKHPDERSLYNYVSKEVLPKILEVIQSEEKKAAMEAALSNRKRSSRIAMRDSEREQREREEMELREQRARAQAALEAERERILREEAETAARRTREDRMRERQERILIRERMLAKRQEAWRRSEEAQVKEENRELGTPKEIDSNATSHSESAEHREDTDMPHTMPTSAPPGPLTTNTLEGLERSFATPASENGSYPAVMEPPEASLSGDPARVHTALGMDSHTVPKNSLAPVTPPYPVVQSSPRNKSPCGSFPLRTQLLRSPLSQAVEPVETPVQMSLGNSILDSESSSALRESPTMPPPS